MISCSKLFKTLCNKTLDRNINYIGKRILRKSKDNKMEERNAYKRLDFIVSTYSF